MKKIRQIPTILGLFILIMGVLGGVVLINKGSKLFLQAESGTTPDQSKITNITETGFTVSWITSQPTSGFIKYGTDHNLSSLAKDDRDQLSGNTGNFLAHHVTIKGLKPATTYFFKIGSGGSLYGNNETDFQINTAPANKSTMPENDVAYGTILDQNGAPAEGVVVYLSLPDAITQSTLTKSSGSWVIPLNLARSSDLSSFVNYNREASVEEIFVQGSLKGTATAITITKNDTPIPSIALGESYDFRETQAESSSNQEPTPTSPESHFSSPDNQGSSAFKETGSISIINPSAGEKIGVQKPEFLGNGPAGEILDIEVNSPNSFKGKTTVQSSGIWTWSPPTNLAPGEHTITVTLANGRSVTRRFTVLAAGESDLPSFTASPSASLTPAATVPPLLSPTPSSILTPTSTPTGYLSPTPTVSQPLQPGNLTPTFLVFIMGSTLFLIGLGGKILIKET